MKKLQEAIKKARMLDERAVTNPVQAIKVIDDYNAGSVTKIVQGHKYVMYTDSGEFAFIKADWDLIALANNILANAE